MAAQFHSEYDGRPARAPEALHELLSWPQAASHYQNVLPQWEDPGDKIVRNPFQKLNQVIGSIYSDPFFSKRATATLEYAVLMEYLKFDNDMAFNYMITHTDMATTLVLTEEQAVNLEHMVRLQP